MPALPAISVDTTTGTSPSIAANIDRDQIILRVTGQPVWFGFKEAAIANQGFFVKNSEVLRISGNKAKCDVYMVTESSTSIVNVEETYTYH